ncbi:MAG: TylF/MycF/NovP-related O-methyltransferase [Sulfuricurvum sp.]|jgi:O-methyltransferase
MSGIEMQKKIDEILSSTPLLSGMVTKSQVYIVLQNLQKTLDDGVSGDVVELGCNVGTTSVFIRKLLDEYKSTKAFHVYDSFEGLPQKLKEDETDLDRQYQEGSCKTSLEVFLGNFEKQGLEAPAINKGWFADIDDTRYPDEISFAFFDGDFYSSIMDSFSKVYPKLTSGARVIIHDYGWDPLPGCKKACDDFLQDKPEKVVMLEVGIGLLVKQ